MPGESFLGATEGSGKYVRTFQRSIGSTLTEDQVIVIGEPMLASYSAVSGFSVSTATASSHLAMLLGGTANKLRVRQIDLWLTGFPSALNPGLMQLEFGKLTTPGNNGGTVTINPFDVSDTAAGATAQSVPTIKGTEGAILYRAAVNMPGGSAASTYDGSKPLISIDADQLRSKPPMTAAGSTTGIYVKNVTGIAGATVAWNIWFDETNF